MEIVLKEITISDLVSGYINSAVNGVSAYNGLLDVRPAFQREFIYKDCQRDAVIRSVINGFPLNTMYWTVSGKNSNGTTTYELLDGQQRTICIGDYYTGRFSIPFIEADGSTHQRSYGNLSDGEKDRFLKYKLLVYVCIGDSSERLAWFRTINIAGEKLFEQEIRNAVYAGPWTTDARRYFSKPGCPAAARGAKFMKCDSLRQEYLEKILGWIVDRDNLVADKDIKAGKTKPMTIDGYMDRHFQDATAAPLWKYFDSIISWIETYFPKHRREMQAVDWGQLYNRYGHDDRLNPAILEERTAKYMGDEDVQKKAGIYPFLLDGDERHLNIRAFRDSECRTAYERQGHKCAHCKKECALEEMEADHITPWSRGGRTVPENCQMLCRDCNRRKSDI